MVEILKVAGGWHRNLPVDPAYLRQSNPRRSKPERCTRAYYALDDFSGVLSQSQGVKN